MSALSFISGEAMVGIVSSSWQESFIGLPAPAGASLPGDGTALAGHPAAALMDGLEGAYLLAPVADDSPGRSAYAEDS